MKRGRIADDKFRYADGHFDFGGARRTGSSTYQTLLATRA